MCGPRISVYLFVVSLCKWSRQEARFILLELVRSLRLRFNSFMPADADFDFLSEVTHPPGWKLERFYDLMIAIIQVQDRWRSFVVEAAVLLDKASSIPITHPIHLLSAEATADLPESPLSNFQKAYSHSMRFKTWISLQACGMSMQDRMRKTEEILLQPKNSSTARTVDALTDVLIFVGWSQSHLDFDIQSSALECFQSIQQLNGTAYEISRRSPTSCGKTLLPIQGALATRCMHKYLHKHHCLDLLFPRHSPRRWPGRCLARYGVLKLTESVVQSALANSQKTKLQTS
ncbi:hypothetical protein B0H14DRAFT_1370259 [Mycena olivaceomarginata]|nr:hypothetical protein B0H14DRAFT_1370259 [Mycena olivaceomarginata]